MERDRWVLLSAAFIALCVVAIVRAQTDDLFGNPSSAERAKTRTGPGAQEEDLFGALSAAESRNQRTPDPAAGTDLFGPSVPAANAAPTPEDPFQFGPANNAVDDVGNSFCKCEGEANLAAIAKIEKVLSSPLRGAGLDFVDTPLAEIVNMLQDEYEIPIQIDTAALEAIGTGSDKPVTLNLQRISLRSALRLMLKQLQLTYIIEDEVLLITTPEVSESRMRVCVYDVRDLIDTHTAALKQLTEVITSSISSRTWDENGGEGSVRSYPPNLLVISQPQSVHEQIQSLLKRMRDMRQR